jgi:drug/metabolite transporter (DMT)-like permease
MNYLGESAALATALLWAFTSIFFAEAGRRIGSFQVNLLRLAMAVVLYAAILYLTAGYLLPPDLNREQILWLSVSGLIGLLLGDGLGFKALVMIGPRLTSLLYSSAPIWATIIAWIVLGEQLGLKQMVGMSLTIGGIVWVVLERQQRSGRQVALDQSHPDSGSLTKGVLLGIGAAVCQAVGLVMAKHGMAHAGGTVDPLPASFLRMAVSLVAIMILAVGRGQIRSTLTAVRDMRGMTYCGVGAVVGPFLGVWMSLVAIKYIATGVASTLNSMTPVMILPLVILFYREKVTWRALGGAVVAVIGVAILFLSE